MPADVARQGCRERALGTVPSDRHLSGRRGERVEEGIALRVNLDAAVRGERLPQQPPMLRQRGRILFRPELVQQLCRPLDIGEKEGDGSGGKRPRHDLMMVEPLRCLKDGSDGGRPPCIDVRAYESR